MLSATEQPSATPERRKKLNYNINDITVALKEIEEGKLKIREASKKYKIPRATLQDRLHGRSKTDGVRLGRNSVLTSKEEECMEHWLVNLAKCGFPLKRNDLQNTVQNIIQEDKRPTPFANQRPGRKWCEAFLKRHPILNERIPEGISKARAIVTEEYIKKWFRDLKSYLDKMKALDILEDPTRILNGDETSFSLCPKTGKVIAPKGWKNVYEIKPGSEKETITVLLVFSAAGETVVPMVVFPYVRPPREVIESMPPNWFLGRSETGWMRSEIFYEYIANGVNNWLIEKNIKRPVLLFVDGHKSHLTMALSEFCDRNGIILYALPPNTTHLLQPADVSVFRPLKVEWRKTVKEWQRKEENFNRSLTKATFCPLLEQALQKDMTQTIRNGFRKCGLYPFNPEAVDFTKCVMNTIENLEKHPVTQVDIDQTMKVLKHFEKPLSDNGIDINKINEIIQRSVSNEPIVLEQNENQSNETDDITVTGINRQNESMNMDIDETQDASIEKPTTEECLLVSTYDLTENEIKDNDSHDKNTHKNVIISDKISTGSRNTLTELNENTQKEATVNKTDCDKVETYLVCPDGSLMQEPLKLDFTISESLINDVDSDFSLSLLDSPTQSATAGSTPSTKSYQLKSGSNTPTNRRGISPCFKKHRFTPKSLNFSKRKTSKENLPSAISSQAWRHFIEEKEKTKQELAKKKEERLKRLQLQRKEKAEKKEELIRKRGQLPSKKAKQNRKCNKKIKASPSATQSRIKCVGCEEDLISDVEEDDLKNIGCDKCPRWFHLKCTVHRGRSYSDVSKEDFICHACYV